MKNTHHVCYAYTCLSARPCLGATEQTSTGRDYFIVSIPTNMLDILESANKSNNTHQHDTSLINTGQSHTTQVFCRWLCLKICSHKNLAEKSSCYIKKGRSHLSIEVCFKNSVEHFRCCKTFLNQLKASNTKLIYLQMPLIRWVIISTC